MALLLRAASLPNAVRIWQVLADTSEEFCKDTFMSLSPPNWLYMLQLYLVKQAKRERAKHKVLAKLVKKREVCGFNSPSALTQARSRPCHLLTALSTTRCSRPDHVAVRRCIVCYPATFKLVLDYRMVKFRTHLTWQSWHGKVSHE